MIRINEKQKQITYYIFSTLITVALILLSVFVFRNSFIRLWESFKDLYYSLFSFFTGQDKATVNQLPIIPPLNNGVGGGGGSVPILPETFNVLKVKFYMFWKLSFNMDNFKNYFIDYGNVMMIVVQVLMILLLVYKPVKWAFRKVFYSPNNNYAECTKPLKVWNTMSAHSYLPIKHYLKSYLNFLKSSQIPRLWLLVILLNFNIFTIIVEFFAYYFYFFYSFDFKSIYVQFRKLILDLSPVFGTVPLIVLILVVVIFFVKIRYKTAIRLLSHMEMLNKQIINGLPVGSLIIGVMNASKTTQMTDFALSKSIADRQHALETMFEIETMFPNYPFINLENYIKWCMDKHKMYNLYTIEKVLKGKFDNNCVCFGYDYKKYPTIFYNGIKNEKLEDCLIDYAKCYFMYIIDESIIQSNYSVREDFAKIDKGNLPLYDFDFFNKTPKQSEELSRYSKIIDQDCLRIGKKVVKESKALFEFGVLLIDEAGKERGNMLDNKDLDKNDEQANRANDLVDLEIKIIRHGATVRHYCYAALLMTEQRAMSLGADARELVTLVSIESVDKQRRTLKGFIFEDMLIDTVYNFFYKIWKNYRFNRGDFSLLEYWIKIICTKLINYRVRIDNKYGYKVFNISMENGTMDGNKTMLKYYRINSKIYNNRFVTDCFANFYKKAMEKNNIGLMDMASYKELRASWEELLSQNSYFINDLNRLVSGEFTTKKKRRNKDDDINDLWDEL